VTQRDDHPPLFVPLVMLNLLSSSQTREADRHTIENKPIASIDLMEAASRSFVDVFTEEFPDYDSSVSIWCGTGNNGGDGLAIARLLKESGYENISVKIVRFNKTSTPDFEVNYRRLQTAAIPIAEIKELKFPEENADIIIDALLGSGLNKPLEGDWKLLADYLNGLKKTVVAVDVPTGFPAEGIITQASAVKADLVVSFQRPKINFFFPESADVFERFEIADIGLDEQFIQSRESLWKLVEETDIRKILKPRKQFSHKGTYGHALIVAGQKGTMGAALLCAEACLHTGAGLTTVCIPLEGLTALNRRAPEIMSLLREGKSFELTDLKKYTSIAVGPGLGTDEDAQKLLARIIEGFPGPAVLDADALNMLGKDPGLISRLAPGSILTPHMKEFDRLFGDHDNWWERVATAQNKAEEFKIFIILKNRYTFIITPDKYVFVNPTGSPAMSSGGMGDVLTGMIVSFLAQGYQPFEAAVLGTYIHGLSGQKGGYVCTASEVIKEIPHVMSNITSH
jgi:hydroxyethylthiazole kinase-like uncharacterized protein yjeF